jgi:ubiquinol-cytochrome c reductase cytochrome c1 subunit
MSKAEYDVAAGDLVNYLVYMGEPTQLLRKKLGIVVLLFLGVFFVLAYYLKKEYWKDIH